MRETILKGQGREVRETPRSDWEAGLAKVPAAMASRLAFMSDDHHRVRYFVVRELPRLGEPIEVSLIAERLDLPLARVEVIVDELEKNLVFLVRNERGAVSWAFPVTVDRTPHHMAFSTGERLYAA